MDGTEATAASGGSASPDIQRGDVGGSVPGNPNSGSPPVPGFRTTSSSSIPAPSNVQGVAIGQVPSTEPVTTKKTSARQYVPDGRTSMKLKATERPRGRPPGTMFAKMGESMNNYAGHACAYHVIIVEAGEDVVQKLLSLSSHQRRGALNILSGAGTASSVTLCQPASTNVSRTYEGRFEILCLSGSYLVSEEGGTRHRSGSMNASLSGINGHVFGGAIAVLIAASPVQIVLSSFVYGNPEMKPEQGTAPKRKSDSENQEDDKTADPISASAARSSTPSTSDFDHLQT